MRLTIGGLVAQDPTRDLVFLISDGRKGGLAINGSSEPVTKHQVQGTVRFRVSGTP